MRSQQDLIKDNDFLRKSTIISIISERHEETKVQLLIAFLLFNQSKTMAAMISFNERRRRKCFKYKRRFNQLVNQRWHKICLNPFCLVVK